MLVINPILLTPAAHYRCYYCTVNICMYVPSKATESLLIESRSMFEYDDNY